MSKELTDKQIAFIDNYLVHFNATRAYIEAGYSTNCKKANIKKRAYEVLNNPNIKEEIKRRINDIHIEKDIMLEKLINKACDIIDNPESKPADVLKAMEYIAKLYALGAENVNVSGTQDLTFNFQVESISANKNE